MSFAAITALVAIASSSTTSEGLAMLDPPEQIEPAWEGQDFSAEQSMFEDDTPMVTGASRRRQTLSEVPVSVSIITADQIRVHGWNSLAEILGHVRGFYVANDLNYDYVGVRGFMRPGDYNARVLLLIDGHAINDPVYLATSIGREVVEPTRIERIEIIRGPGSALYGGSALLAVINVVTRTGPDLRSADGAGAGVSLSVDADSQGKGSTTIGFDRWIGAKTRLALSVAAFGGLGQAYSFPELGLDGPTARHSDREGGLRMFSRFEHGPFSLQAGYTDRNKQVPTASYDTLPGEELATQDRHLYASGQVQLELAPNVGWSAQLAIDNYYYYGVYPYAEADGGLLDDFANGTLLTLETSIVAEIQKNLVLNIGASAQRTFALDAWFQYRGSTAPGRDFGYGVLGVFADAELRVIPGLSVFAGGRIDFYETFGAHASPRAAVVIEPWTGTIFRGSYGTAFRAPNTFELYYGDGTQARGATNPNLRPEVLEQFEGSAEQTLFDGRAHVGVAVFRFDMRDLIDGVDAGSESFVFANIGTARAVGGELWADARLPFLDAHVEVSYSASLARDVSTGAQLSASPLHMFSGSTDFSLGIEGLRFAASARYVGQRRAADGLALIPGALVIDTAASWRNALPGLDLSLGIKNTFDAAAFVPGSLEHVEHQLPQEGISAWVRLSSVF